MAKQVIMEVAELRKAVKKAKIVLVQARFGCSENWLKIAKSEVLEQLIAHLEGSPEHNEMYAGQFGVLEESGELYLG